jgi:predicted heme/steroid binding protein/uncharacterized membrane protein
LDKLISEEELRASDGQQDRPAYIVYKGRVYDVSQSRLWRKGVHVRRHYAGNDLTADIAAAPHDESVFERVPLVGELETAALPQEAGTCPEEETTLADVRPTDVRPTDAYPTDVRPPDKHLSLLDFYFEQHPHPVAVHFPVALSVMVAVVVALYLFTNTRVLETTAYYVLWGAVIMGPVSIMTGAFSWWHNYGHKLTDNFKDKISFSAIYIVLGAVALALRTANPNVLVERESLGWVYVMLVMAQIPVVSILGWVGTKILFPPKK